jgi:hypothetical protein
MRMMLKVVVDTAAGNEALRNGSLAKIVQTVVEQLKPEAAYFAPEDGQRAMFLVFDLANPSQIPAVVEPMFVGSRARVTLTPCMNYEDLQQGLAQLPPDLAVAGS